MVDCDVPGDTAGLPAPVADADVLSVSSLLLLVPRPERDNERTNRRKGLLPPPAVAEDDKGGEDRGGEELAMSLGREGAGAD